MKQTFNYNCAEAIKNPGLELKEFEFDIYNKQKEIGKIVKLIDEIESLRRKNEITEKRLNELTEKNNKNEFVLLKYVEQFGEFTLKERNLDEICKSKDKGRYDFSFKNMDYGCDDKTVMAVI